MFEVFQESLVQAGGYELLEAVNDEFRRGRQVQEGLVKAQIQRISSVCSQLESSAIDGLGNIESDIPAEIYFHWLNEGRKRGTNNIWQHECFRREFLRDHPQLKVRYRPRAMSGWRSSRLERAAREGQARQQQTLIATS
jgi:hypothetical protein